MLHFCKQDGVLMNPDEDSVQFYAALRDGNEGRTHVIITSDGGHNDWSDQLTEAEWHWQSLYNIPLQSSEYESHYDLDSVMKFQTPTVEEFRSQIFAS